MRPTILAIALALFAADVSASERPTVAIRNADRSIYGTLRLSASRDSLLLSWQGEEQPFGGCADKAIQETRSPEGVVATVSQRNCGATVDFATRITLVSGAQTYVVAIFEGTPVVSVAWSDGVLHASHSPLPSSRVFRREASTGPHRIVYSTGGQAAPPSEYVDFANFNYGATGRAAGLPAELLQRAAGWAQEASGLYRAEWGSWTGAHPYGDDPRGRAKVKEGMEYFEAQAKTNRSGEAQNGQLRSFTADPSLMQTPR